LKKENNEDNSKDSETNQSTNPQRRQHPPPRPSDVTSKFQTNKQNSQQTRESDTAGRRRVAGHGVSFVDEYNITPPNSVVKG